MIDTRTVWVLDLLQCNSHGDVRARLLTLVQVGDCWNYALEAIINVVIIIIPIVAYQVNPSECSLFYQNMLDKVGFGYIPPMNNFSQLYQ